MLARPEDCKQYNSSSENQAHDYLSSNKVEERLGSSGVKIPCVTLSVVNLSFH